MLTLTKMLLAKHLKAALDECSKSIENCSGLVEDKKLSEQGRDYFEGMRMDCQAAHGEILVLSRKIMETKDDQVS